MVLQKIFGKKDSFPYPKSIWAVKDILELVTSPNSLVLDFFAGSGTTGHAVALLNKEDGGRRRFILCTNDESGIAREVCYPRLKGVAEGVSTAPGITGIPFNLHYYKTFALDKSAGRDDLAITASSHCADLLGVREECHEKIFDGENYTIFIGSNKAVCIYFSPDSIDLHEAIARLGELQGNLVLYCFTLDPFGVHDLGFGDPSPIQVEPIPQGMIELFEGLSLYGS